MIRSGDRVELVSCADRYTRLRPGEQGTVSFVDSLGTVHVDWDSGSHLGLVPDHDVYKKLPGERNKPAPIDPPGI